MRSAYITSPDAQAHDAHLRSLSPRGEQADRYSTLSQFSDTPSVYSRANYGHGNADRTDTQSFSSEYYHPHDGLERFQNRHTSTLDFSDDRSSPSSTPDDDDSHSFEDQRNGDEDTADRMSYLGPKMRFHSLAPWEMGAETVDEEEEPTESPRAGMIPFSFGKASSASSSPRPSHTNSRPSEEASNVHKRSFDTINSQMSSKGTL